MRDRRLRAATSFYRAHGLGNDYLVFEVAGSEGDAWHLDSATLPRVCHRGKGEGADGVVVLLDRRPTDGVFPLRMFNPDGSEFERSGNGLRILASYLMREGLVDSEPFRVRSGGSVIPMTIHGVTAGGCYDVSVEMGLARVGLEAVAGRPSRLDAEGRAVHPEHGPVSFVPVSVGNPHAVVFHPELSDGTLLDLGPFLSTHAAFSEGVNVQLVEVTGPDRIRIGIWERGVGRTSASGTSSCAAAVAAVSSGRLAPGDVTVEMDGGRLQVSVDEDLNVILRGPVDEVAEGQLTAGFMAALERLDRDGA